MEQIDKSVVSGGQALQLRTNQYSVLANSNAISTTHGKFFELTADVKKVDWIAKQKALTTAMVRA